MLTSFSLSGAHLKIGLYSTICRIDTVSKLQSQDGAFVLLSDFEFDLCSLGAWTA